MHLTALRVRNFRRLKDVLIDLAGEISIFVGANNSGKTSVAHVLQLFLSGAKDKFSFHDFSAAVWPEVELFSDPTQSGDLPIISIDLWFEVKSTDLHKVIDLLPSLDWSGNRVGVRISYCPKDAAGILTRFEAAQTSAQVPEQVDAVAPLLAENETNMEPIADEIEEPAFIPSPKNLTEYLENHLRSEYEFRYFVLNEAMFDEKLIELQDYQPQEIITDKDPNKKTRSGKDIINSMIKVDFMEAQRHLSDNSGGARNEDLSRHLSRFYKRNLEKRENDLNAVQALSKSEALMNDHLEDVFAETLTKLAVLGYPGLTNPRLKIMSDLNPATLMSNQDGAAVHYALDDNVTLPDKYNGLGYKNLIYMVVEILDLHSQWMDIEEYRPPLHLIFIEEPEAHLHTQLQQVFVNKVLDILRNESGDIGSAHSQVILTTHSPHILYERGFAPIRYFRRENSGPEQSSNVINLSGLYKADCPDRDFLERYLKLTHCDLFFADAAILVEGNVERLLTPTMIQKATPGLKSVFLSTLEIGGAYGYRFKSLIEHLGLTTLIITDIDSVHGVAAVPEPIVAVEGDLENTEELDEYENIDEDTDGPPKIGSTCRVEAAFANTSNQTLIQWLPGITSIEELLDANADAKTLNKGDGIPANVHVCYQTKVNVERDGQTIELTGRTLEEAFAFENLAWCQEMSNKELRLRVKSSDNPALEETCARLHKRIHGKNFKKTDFALALLSKNPDDWMVPTYIRQGLEWLQSKTTTLTPIEELAQPVEALEND